MSNHETAKCYKEITAQDAALSRTLAYMETRRETLRDFWNRGDGDIVFVASGSSYWMSLSAHITARLRTGRKAYAVKAGDVLLCAEEYTQAYHNPTFVCPSRSGKTSEVLLAVGILQKAYPGSRLLSIVINEGSELESLSDVSLLMPWANEESVCQTSSFSCLYLASVLMAECAVGDHLLFEECRRFLAATPTLYAKTHEAVRGFIASRDIQALVCLGAGRQYGICIEGAYIVIEMAQFNANYYNLLEYRHGPIVTANQGTVVFMLSNESSEDYEAALANEIRQTGATVAAIGARAQAYADASFVLGDGFSKEMTALFYIYCLQIFAYELAVKRGVDPDYPGKLVAYIQF